MPTSARPHEKPAVEEHDERRAEAERGAGARDRRDRHREAGQAGRKRAGRAEGWQADGRRPEADRERRPRRGDGGRQAERRPLVVAGAARGDQEQERGKGPGHDPEGEHGRGGQGIGQEGREDEDHQGAPGRRPGAPGADRDPRPQGDDRAGRDEEPGHGTAGLGLASPFPTGAAYSGVSRIPRLEIGQ